MHFWWQSFHQHSCYFSTLTISVAEHFLIKVIHILIGTSDLLITKTKSNSNSSSTFFLLKTFSHLTLTPHYSFLPPLYIILKCSYSSFSLLHQALFSYHSTVPKRFCLFSSIQLSFMYWWPTPTIFQNSLPDIQVPFQHFCLHVFLASPIIVSKIEPMTSAPTHIHTPFKHPPLCCHLSVYSQRMKPITTSIYIRLLAVWCKSQYPLHHRQRNLPPPPLPRNTHT